MRLKCAGDAAAHFLSTLSNHFFLTFLSFTAWVTMRSFLLPTGLTAGSTIGKLRSSDSCGANDLPCPKEPHVLRSR